MFFGGNSFASSAPRRVGLVNLRTLTEVQDEAQGIHMSHGLCLVNGVRPKMFVNVSYLVLVNVFHMIIVNIFMIGQSHSKTNAHRFFLDKPPLR